MPEKWHMGFNSVFKVLITRQAMYIHINVTMGHPLTTIVTMEKQ
jgi:hypothetical protein